MDSRPTIADVLKAMEARGRGAVHHDDVLEIIRAAIRAPRGSIRPSDALVSLSEPPAGASPESVTLDGLVVGVDYGLDSCAYVVMRTRADGRYEVIETGRLT